MSVDADFFIFLDSRKLFSWKMYFVNPDERVKLWLSKLLQDARPDSNSRLAILISKFFIITPRGRRYRTYTIWELDRSGFITLGCIGYILVGFPAAENDFAGCAKPCDEGAHCFNHKFQDSVFQPRRDFPAALFAYSQRNSSFSEPKTCMALNLILHSDCIENYLHRSTQQNIIIFFYSFKVTFANCRI